VERKGGPGGPAGERKVRAGDDGGWEGGQFLGLFRRVCVIGGDAVGGGK
jgi:hypothetical protein